MNLWISDLDVHIGVGWPSYWSVRSRAGVSWGRCEIISGATTVTRLGKRPAPLLIQPGRFKIGQRRLSSIDRAFSAAAMETGLLGALPVSAGSGVVRVLSAWRAFVDEAWMYWMTMLCCDTRRGTAYRACI